MDRGENLPFKFPSLLTGLSGPFKIVSFDGVNSRASIFVYLYIHNGPCPLRPQTKASY